MVSVILGLIAIIAGGGLYPVSMQSRTLGLIIGGVAVVFAILGIVLSRRTTASDKDRTNNKEGMWLSIAGGVIALFAGAIVLLVR